MAAGTEIPRPHVVTDQSLLDSTIPFRLEFDEERAAMLLHDNGMDTSKIEGLSIVLTGKGKTGFQHGGTYFGPATPNPEKVIMLSGEETWKKHEKRLRKERENPETVLAETNRDLNRNFLSLAHFAIEDSRYALWRRPLHEEMIAFYTPGGLTAWGYHKLIGPYLADPNFVSMLPPQDDPYKVLMSVGIYAVGLCGTFYGGMRIASEVYARLKIIPGETNRANKKFIERTETNSNFNAIVKMIPTGA